MLTTEYEFTSDWFSHHSKQWLSLLSNYIGQPHVRYLEIGAYEGRSVVWMFENILTGKNASAVCLDIWEDPAVAERFDLNVAEFNIKKLVGDSYSQLINISSSEAFDIIYIDGSHEARDVMADAVLAFRLLNVGGTFIFDDYRWNLRGRVDVLPKIAINGFLAAYAPVIDVLATGYQVFLMKK